MEEAMASDGGLKKWEKWKISIKNEQKEATLHTPCRCGSSGTATVHPSSFFGC